MYRENRIKVQTLVWLHILRRTAQDQASLQFLRTLSRWSMWVHYTTCCLSWSWHSMSKIKTRSDQINSSWQKSSQMIYFHLLSECLRISSVSQCCNIAGNNTPVLNKCTAFPLSLSPGDFHLTGSHTAHWSSAVCHQLHVSSAVSWQHLISRKGDQTKDRGQDRVHQTQSVQHTNTHREPTLLHGGTEHFPRSRHLSLMAVMLCLLLATPLSPADSQVIDLKVIMTLGAFNVLVCDQSCNMADIKIQGTESAEFVSAFSCWDVLDLFDVSCRNKHLFAEARPTDSHISPPKRFHCPQCWSEKLPQEGESAVLIC